MTETIEQMVIRAAKAMLAANSPFLDKLPGARTYWSNLANGRKPNHNDFLKAAEAADLFDWPIDELDRLLDAAEGTKGTR